MAEKGPKYFFRGTTKGFKWNASTTRIAITCTTANPAIALIFARFCSTSSHQKVVYFARAENLQGVRKRYNHKASALRKREEETGFLISPIEFYKRCEGYLSPSEVAAIIKKELGIDLAPCVSLDDCLEQVKPMKKAQLDKFWNAAINKILLNRGPDLADDLGI